MRVVFVIAALTNFAAFVFGIVIVLQEINPQYRSSVDIENLMFGVAVLLGSFCSILIFSKRGALLATPDSWLGLEVEARKAKLRSRIREAASGDKE